MGLKVNNADGLKRALDKLGVKGRREPPPVAPSRFYDSSRSPSTRR